MATNPFRNIISIVVSTLCQSMAFNSNIELILNHLGRFSFCDPISPIKKILNKPKEKMKNTKDKRKKSTASMSNKAGGSAFSISEKVIKWISPEINPQITSLHSIIPLSVKINEMINMKKTVGIKTYLRPSNFLIGF
jgi:hypothetical protein